MKSFFDLVKLRQSDHSFQLVLIPNLNKSDIDKK